ncbi:MAG: DinB family protein [Chloroflexi bacterium]|nr:DinB family protein [Chloroflexota bacterium]
MTEDLQEDGLRWQAGPRAPSIRFHLWHIARWADKVQAGLPTLTPALRRLGSAEELWAIEGLAARWGLDASLLGEGETGMGLDDAVVAALPLPTREELLGYARRAFGAVDERAAQLGTGELVAPCTDLYGNANVVGDVLLSHLTHVSRHLGMIEALRGVQGMHGTATW